ncbi:MAG: hypothetical protein U1A28_01345, partial [Patescibacteria group bacterium]|nr:hypothetical protein [Patescibacteria group bacterium]
GGIQLELFIEKNRSIQEYLQDRSLMRTESVSLGENIFTKATYREGALDPVEYMIPKAGNLIVFVPSLAIAPEISIEEILSLFHFIEP